MSRKHTLYGAVLLILTLFIPHAHVQAASQFRVTLFYTSTLAANAGLTKGEASAPAHTAVFPAGTPAVGYYFEFTGAQPKVTQFQIIQHSPDHSVFKGVVHTLHNIDGSFSNDLDTEPAFAPGKYTLDVLSHGKILATTSFMVKPGIKVLNFFPTTLKVMDAWQNSTSSDPPTRTITFPAGTTDVGYYFEFTGITPKVTTFRVTIYDSTGATYLSGDVHTLHNIVGSFGNSFHNDPAFSKGTYRMTVALQGAPPRSTTFTVGG